MPYADPERQRAYERAWRERNSTYDSDRYYADKDYRRAIGHKRRLRLAGWKGPTPTSRELRDLTVRTRKCPLCKTKLTDDPHQPNTKHIDHIIPVALEPIGALSNLRVVCASCNQKRPHDGSDLGVFQTRLV